MPLKFSPEATNVRTSSCPNGGEAKGREEKTKRKSYKKEKKRKVKTASMNLLWWPFLEVVDTVEAVLGGSLEPRLGSS